MIITETERAPRDVEGGVIFILVYTFLNVVLLRMDSFHDSLSDVASMVKSSYHQIPYTELSCLSQWKKSTNQNRTTHARKRHR